MTALTVYHLRYTIRAEEPLALDQHPGSALRGALFRALLTRFCALPQQPECATCPLVASCPVAELLAPLRDENPRGRDVPRPFVIRPPLIASFSENGMRLEAGQRTSFTVALVGRAARLFPYVVMSTTVLQSLGLGRPVRANGGRRGRFTVEEIASVHPFAAQEASLYRAGQSQVSVPEIAITAADIQQRAATLPADVTLRFLTPTRLTDGGKLVHTPEPDILARRLAERMDALEAAYAPVPIGAAIATGGRWRAVADVCDAHLAQSAVTWVDTQSYSSRQGRRVPMGGFVGTARIAGDLTPELRELLVWGEVLHVGKDTVKGNGWYQLG